MRVRFAAAFALLLSGCVTLGGPEGSVTVPPGTFGPQIDQTAAALDLAQFAFADAGRIYGKPAEAARAVAAVEYLAAQFATQGGWGGLSASTRADMDLARLRLRQTLDIPRTASPQAVTDALLAASVDFSADQLAAARAALQPPVFPDAAHTVAVLQDMPYILVANQATSEAEAEVADASTNACFNCLNNGTPIR